MKPLKERLERIEIEEPVNIPNLDGNGIAETIKVKVPAWRDPKDGEVYLDSEATAMLDKVKARHMGLLKPEHIKALRKRLHLTQPQVSELLQIGEKTWTRWETGRERPSRSINVLLYALNDGKLDVAYLRSVARRRNDWTTVLADATRSAQNCWLTTVQGIWEGWEPADVPELPQAMHDAFVSYLASRQTAHRATFVLKAKGDFPSSLPSNVVPVQPGMWGGGSGRGMRPADPSPESIPAFDLPDQLFVA